MTAGEAMADRFEAAVGRLLQMVSGPMVEDLLKQLPDLERCVKDLRADKIPPELFRGLTLIVEFIELAIEMQDRTSGACSSPAPQA